MSGIPGRPYSAAINRHVDPGATVGSLDLLLFVAFSLAVGVWGATSIAGTSGYELEKFISLAGLFGVACAFFVMPRLRAGFQSLFELPVFMTVVAFLQFGAAPLVCFLDPDVLTPKLHGDTSLFHPALLIVTAGMVAFWLGSTIARPRKLVAPLRPPAPLSGAGPPLLTVVFGAFLYLVSFAAKVYMVRAGMYSYIASFDVTHSRVAEVQVFIVIANFGLFALILFAIELHYHPADRIRAGLFWTVLASQCFWGLISGMKSEVLYNFVSVGIVFSLAGRKLRLRWFAIAILGLVALYPLINEYRFIVRGPARQATTSVSDAVAAMRQAGMRSAGREETAGDWVAAGWASAVGRFDMLENVAMLMAYQDRSFQLEGDERLWMIPFYPLVPRFIWPSKPVQDFGGRLTRLIGGSRDTGTSPTVLGDLYVLHGGIPGLLAGMFLLGLAAQWLTNLVKLRPSKRNLFIYAGTFFFLGNYQQDFFAFSTAAIRAFVILQILAAIIYGPVWIPPLLRTRRETSK